jgi:mitofilin
LSVRRDVSRSSFLGPRRMTTSKQKRALSEEQIVGKTKGEQHVQPIAVAAPPAALEKKISSSANVGSNNTGYYVAGGGAAIAMAGGAYYFYKQRADKLSDANAGAAAAALVEKKAAVAPAVNEKEAAAVPTKKDAAAVKVPTKVKETTAKELSNSCNAAVKDPTKVETLGNRVTTIQLPDKMRNKAPETSTLQPPEHPVNGNRVTGLPKGKTLGQTPPSTVDTSPDRTNAALEQLKHSSAASSSASSEAQEAVVSSHSSLWSNAAILNDLDKLSPSQLRTRIVQLATELQDRTKWEAVRLKEFLAMKEQEGQQETLVQLQKQRLELQDILAKRLREQEHELTVRAQQQLDEKDAATQQLLDSALAARQQDYETEKHNFTVVTTQEITAQVQEEADAKMERYKAQVAQELANKMTALTKLADRLRQLEAALETLQANQSGSNKAHRLSAAALRLTEQLESGQPGEWNALKAAAGPTGVIATAVASIPARVQQNGLPTMAELQVQFESVYKRCRQAAMVPQGRFGLEGQLAGIVLSALRFPPSPDDPAPENDKDNAEFVLVRARKYLQVGELERAVEQLEKLEGQAAFTVQDWKEAALDRIAVEKALKVIKMECALLNQDMAK